MKVVTLAQAKAGLSAILDRVEAGEPIAISRRHRVIASILPAAGKRRTRPRPAGLCRGEFEAPDDFDAPLPDGVAAGFDGR